jgi:hypothetical protein
MPDKSGNYTNMPCLWRGNYNSERITVLKEEEIKIGGDSDLTELKLRLVPMKTSWD